MTGRPWNDLATTVYLRTFMDDTVEPIGWTPFDSARFVPPLQLARTMRRITYPFTFSRPVIMNTTFYAEFDNFGE